MEETYSEHEMDNDFNWSIFTELGIFISRKNAASARYMVNAMDDKMIADGNSIGWWFEATEFADHDLQEFAIQNYLI